MSARPTFTLALVANSDRAAFPGRRYRALRDAGHEVVPVDLAGSRYVQGDEAFATLSAVPQRLDGVVVELPPSRILPLLDELVRLGISKLWLTNGVGPELSAHCQARGIELGKAKDLLPRRSWWRRGDGV
ncbi:MAG: CoA-binding protein [Deltaproteobacteria bacterium]|nr:CoA-binding protein [Deltaproteobacteria bacterium]